MILRASINRNIKIYSRVHNFQNSYYCIASVCAAATLLTFYDNINSSFLSLCAIYSNIQSVFSLINNAHTPQNTLYVYFLFGLWVSQLNCILYNIACTAQLNRTQTQVCIVSSIYHIRRSTSYIYINYDKVHEIGENIWDTSASSQQIDPVFGLFVCVHAVACSYKCHIIELEWMVVVKTLSDFSL